jgi:Ser/Thr protein kinase RdoA (MazF antagonist)
MAVTAKPDSARIYEFDEVQLDKISTAFRLENTGMLLPILIEGDNCVLLEVRSSTSRKAIVASGGERFFLKEIPWYARGDRDLQTSQALQRVLEQEGAPIASLLRTIDGHDHLDIDDARFTVSRFIDGEVFAWRAGQVASAGSALARVHNSSAQLPDADREDLFARAALFLRLAAERERADEASLLKFMSALLADRHAVAREAGAANLPKFPLHGDFSPWNLIFRGDDVAAIVDFDNADYGVRLRDLTEAVLAFCGIKFAADSTSFARPFAVEFQADRAAALLSAYESVVDMPLTDAEVSVIDHYFVAISILYVALGLLRGDFDATRDHVAIEAWLTSPPSVAEVIGALRHG